MGILLAHEELWELQLVIAWEWWTGEKWTEVEWELCSGVVKSGRDFEWEMLLETTVTEISWVTPSWGNTLEVEWANGFHKRKILVPHLNI